MTSRLGIDVGGSSIKWAVLEGERVVADGSVVTPSTDAAAVLAAVAAIAREQGADTVGLALPAVVDGGSTRMAPNLPGEWDGLAVTAPLEAELGVPVSLCNDARAFTLAEWRLGVARGRRDVLAVALGTGVGGGVVSDGRLVRGSGGRAGEFGHLLVDPKGIHCGCGARGCLETFAGAWALVRASGLPSAEAVVTAARAGDRSAAAVLTRAGDAIGRALSVLGTALAPELVVVGGGLAGALDLLRPAIDERLRERFAFIGDCPILPGQLGLRAGAIGAALWGAE